ncbi:MAG: SDR family oxidoreductase [Candidatus Altiarchaeota archaeon]
MKVLVTGGAGFIGSHITDRLIQEGFEVSVVDDLSTGSRKNLNSAVKFYETSICDPALSRVLSEVEPDVVVHQAAQINVRKSIEDPVFDANVNISGSVNLLEACRDSGVRKVVYASSGGAVYGEPQYLPADENHPIRPLCPYGASKYSVESFLHTYHALYGIDYVALRYSNVYGPRQDPHGEAGVVAIFAKKFLEGESPTIFGDGEQTRDFVYVGDVAEANMLAISSKIKAGAFNIGVGVETSVNEIAGKIRDITGSRVLPVHGPEVKGEVRRIFLDIKLARRKLSWKPKVGLDEGLSETAGYFRK